MTEPVAADRPGGGLFVVFEGGDGAGKSTQAGLLAQHLVAVGRTVRLTFEPGDSPVGGHIRRLLLDPASGDVAPRAEALLYAADKAQHVHQVVAPSLARGEVVVSDRYVDSMIAYQGAGRAVAADQVAALAWWAVDQLRPDLTVLLDVSVERALTAKTDWDRIEQAGLDFHQRVRDHLLTLAAADPERHLVLDGRQPVEWIAQRVAARVDRLLADQPLSEPSGRLGP
ncbi:MAG: dTMP kinase [Propionibacteriaceae bacterium]|nr:dTMP kinase [Propionibacteriaceae bacterium]